MPSDRVGMKFARTTPPLFRRSEDIPQPVKNGIAAQHDRLNVDRRCRLERGGANCRHRIANVEQFAIAQNQSNTIGAISMKACEFHGGHISVTPGHARAGLDQRGQHFKRWHFESGRTRNFERRAEQCIDLHQSSRVEVLQNAWPVFA